MGILRSLGRDVGRYILLYIAVSLLVRTSWQPIVHQAIGFALAISFLITILHCLLHDAVPVFIYELERKVILIEYAIVGICAALSFSVEKLSTLFS